MNKRTLENDEFCSLSWTENNNEELYEFGTLELTTQVSFYFCRVLELSVCFLQSGQFEVLTLVLLTTGLATY